MKRLFDDAESKYDGPSPAGFGHMGVFRRIGTCILRVLPDAYEKIPSDPDLNKARQESLDNIVRQHAEGSVLLGAGQYVIDRDLLEDGDDLTSDRRQAQP